MTSIYNTTINRLYDSIVWTHKIQRTYLEKLELRRKILEIIKILVTSLSSISTSLFAFVNNYSGVIISSIFVLISLVLTDVLKQIETEKNIKIFKRSSESLFEIKNSMLELSDEIKANKIDDDIIKIKLELYKSKYSLAISDLPTIPNKIVNIASKKLKERKDEEVDLKLL